MENKPKYIKTFEEFISEQAYDEQDAPTSASYRSEDYQAKEDLRQTAVMVDEILRLIEDGEQLEGSQLELVKTIFTSINALKRQIHGRERIKRDQEDERDEIQNQNTGHQ